MLCFKLWVTATVMSFAWFFMWTGITLGSLSGGTEPTNAQLMFAVFPLIIWTIVTVILGIGVSLWTIWQ